MLRRKLYSFFRKKIIPRIKDTDIFEKVFPLKKGGVGENTKIHQFLVSQALKDTDYETYPRPKGSIVDEDWDVLVILDACRYDLYNDLYGCEKRVSRATSTPEWLNVNFKGFYDMIYISSNPHVSDAELDGFRGTDHFSHIENVWDYGWDDEMNTVPPERITDKAIEMNKNHPDKRMVVHYMQPHQPFVGEKVLDYPSKENNAFTAFDALASGQVTKEEMWEAYRSNLKLVKKEVDRLVENVSGKIMITSDHGNSFGPVIYAHPSNIRIKELVEVPMIVHDKRTGEEKKRTNVEKDESKSKTDENEIRKKLEKLGYIG